MAWLFSTSQVGTFGLLEFWLILVLSVPWMGHLRVHCGKPVVGYPLSTMENPLFTVGYPLMHFQELFHFLVLSVLTADPYTYLRCPRCPLVLDCCGIAQCNVFKVSYFRFYIPRHNIPSSTTPGGIPKKLYRKAGYQSGGFAFFVPMGAANRWYLADSRKSHS